MDVSEYEPSFLEVIDSLKQRTDYADLRWVEHTHEYIEVKNGEVVALARSSDMGFGIRVLYKGAWGFASSYDLTPDSIRGVADKALSIAQASYRLIREPVRLAPEDVHIDTYVNPVRVDPFTVAIDDKLDLLFKVDSALRHPHIPIREVFMDLWRERKLFINTEGSKIFQDITHTGAGMQVTAFGEDMQVRSYGNFKAAGYEYLEELDLISHTDRVKEEVLALTKAPVPDEAVKDIIIAGDQLALQIHESCGHPIELDRVLGTEASFYGTSFLTLDKLGKFQYGSKHVNIVADATHKDALGGFGYDDEGVKAQRTDIVREGVFVGYLTSRETASILGQRSNGAMRASSWNRIPLIRMTSIDLEPGEWELEDMIADIKDGIYFETNKSWSIDEKRLNFQFGTEIAWEIKNGRRTQVLRNAIYTGITPEFWRSCDAIANKKYWQIYGVPGCGKGEPGQSMRVSHGTAPARFRKVRVGYKNER